MFNSKAAELEQLDHEDPLADMRQHFELPADLVYLDGNSLGPLPLRVKARMQDVLEQQWGEQLVRAWNDSDWVNLPQRVGARIAPLLGAAAEQVIVADSTSINIYKLLGAAVDLRPDRSEILLEQGAFPTDNYIADGLAERVVGVRARAVPTASLIESIGSHTAVVLLSHVNYRNGALLDMAAITQAAHAHGALVLWDLAHSAGAMPLHLDQHHVDFAVGCGYKFLNGGPGAPSFAYVAQRHHAAMQPWLRGWFGHARPFAFEADYAPAVGTRSLLVGTPPVLSLSALDEALTIWEDVSLDAVRKKSLQLFDTLLGLIESSPVLQDFELLTPRDATDRGSQLSLAHPQAYAISSALIEQGVIGDYREPGILRLGLTPLYLSFADLGRAVAALEHIMQEQLWRAPRHQNRAEVT